MKNEKWDDVHGNTTPDDRMVAFLESPTDSYAILQLREDVDDNIPLMFANYSYLQKKEMEPEIDRYEVVYHGSILCQGAAFGHEREKQGKGKLFPLSDRACQLMLTME